ncbi:MAG TPA: hypothetical protein VLK33_19640, partial [Terriglobales bacterium]|nr:hypothetical protein [Terriglobales bacterium]
MLDPIRCATEAAFLYVQRFLRDNASNVPRTRTFFVALYLQLDARNERAGSKSQESKLALVTVSRLSLRTAIGAISTTLQAGNNDMELAVALNLPFQSIKEIALKFSNLSAPETCHVNVIALRTALVKM